MPLEAGNGNRSAVTEGITYFDHPQNPAFPAKWHVREDGWMGASACRDVPLVTTRQSPLRLRYLLYVHSGPVDPARAAAIAAEWRARPRLEVIKSTRPHRQFELREV
jgi:hypothetical protein